MEKDTLTTSNLEGNNNHKNTSIVNSSNDNDHDIVKVKWDKFIKMKKRDFEEDYKIES